MRGLAFLYCWLELDQTIKLARIANRRLVYQVADSILQAYVALAVLVVLGNELGNLQ